MRWVAYVRLQYRFDPDDIIANRLDDLRRAKIGLEQWTVLGSKKTAYSLGLREGEKRKQQNYRWLGMRPKPQQWKARIQLRFTCPPSVPMWGVMEGPLNLISHYPHHPYGGGIGTGTRPYGEWLINTGHPGVFRWCAGGTRKIEADERKWFALDE